MPTPDPENAAPLIVRSLEELGTAVRRLREKGGRIGLVPTMGALHAGHLSLVHACRQQCDATIVSIFVNPTQFGPAEDLSKYPRPIDNDLRLLSEANVDVVFMPEPEVVYPDGCSTSVDPPRVAAALEGEFRPTHFRGVATVVLKLFHMTQADVAFFGQKDYQQSLVIRHLVRDLNVPIDIVVCPIVRDDDGLALSSRNVFLSSADRQVALSLSRTLDMAEKMIRQGENDARIVMAEMTQALIEGGVTELEYAVVADANTLQWLDEVRLPAALLVAARVGTTRLIDNIVLN